VPDLSQIAQDPAFLALDAAGKAKVMAHFDPDFHALDTEHKDKVVAHFQGAAVAHGAESIGLDPHISVAQAHAESGLDENAVSPKGAEGIMQVMPQTAAEVRRAMAAGTLPTAQGVPEHVAVGLAYQHQMKEKFKDDALALAAYNAGPGRVEEALAKAKAAGQPPTIQGAFPYLPKETQDYVTKILHGAGTMKNAPPAGGGAPQGQGAPEMQQQEPTTQSTPTTTQPPDRNPLSVAAQRLIAQPGAEFNSLLHKMGVSPIDPLAARNAGLRYGIPGAENWPSRDPEGVLETTGAALAPAEALWPTGALAGIAAQTLTNKRFADTVEGVMGLGMLAKSGVQGFRALRGRTPNELKHLSAIEEAGKAQSAVEPARQGVAAARADVEAAQSSVEDAKAAHEAVQSRVDAAVEFHAQEAAKLDEARRAQPSTVGQVREALGAQGAPTQEMAGRILQAPSSTGGGAQAGMSIHLKRVTQLYENGRVIGDKLKAVMPAKGADHIAVLDGVRDYLKHGGDPLDPVVERLRNLGLSGVTNRATGEFIPLTDPEQVNLMLDANPDLEKSYRDITYRELSENYAGIANQAFTPGAYAGSTNRGERAFYRLARGTLKLAMEKIEQGDPDLHAAAVEADRYYREKVVPYRRTTKALLSPSVEPIAAYNKLVSNPASMLRYFDHASEVERDAHQGAYLDGLIRRHTNSLGEVDFDKVLNDWDREDETVRSLVSSGANEQSAQVLNQWVARRKQLDTAERDLASFKRQLTANKTKVLNAAKADVREAIKAMKEAKSDARTAQAAFKGARDTARAAQRNVLTTGRLPVGSRTPEAGASTMAGAGRMWGRRHAIMSAFFLVVGHMQAAAIQASLAALMLRRPRLVAAAVRTPLTAPEATVVAAALQAAIRAVTKNPALASPSQSTQPQQAQAAR
jgi:hypothetical protein